MSFITELTKLVKRIFNVETAQLRTNTVCQVVSYDGDTNLVNLQPCIMTMRTDDVDSPVKQLPQVNDIPVWQWGSGKLVGTAAPQPGAYGLYVVSDRKLENWIVQGGVVPPGSKMRFDLSNGFFLPGLYPTVVDGDNGKLQGAVQTDRISLRTRDGSSEISMVDDGTVEIVSSSVELNSSVDAVALSTKVDLLWTTLDTVMRTAWVVAPTDGGAALKAAYIAAFPTPPTSVASTKLKLDS